MVFLEECLVRVSGGIPRKKPQQGIPRNDSRRNLQIELGVESSDGIYVCLNKGYRCQNKIILVYDVLDINML